MADETVALITGAARRIGASIAVALHSRGCAVMIHCRDSRQEADQLAAQLNEQRADSALVVQADLLQMSGIEALARDAVRWRGHLDVLVNSASSFYPTPIGSVTDAQWNELMGSNLRAPFFLSQALVDPLKARGGSIVNLIDIHAERPMPRHPVYCAAKAGLEMLTQSMALELAPDVRVNGVAPGAILWPEGEGAASHTQQILEKVPMRRSGEPDDIAAAVCFFALEAPYVTGQVLAVDGGRSLNL